MAEGADSDYTPEWDISDDEGQEAARPPPASRLSRQDLATTTPQGQPCTAQPPLKTHHGHIGPPAHPGPYSQLPGAVRPVNCSQQAASAVHVTVNGNTRRVSGDHSKHHVAPQHAHVPPGSAPALRPPPLVRPPLLVRPPGPVRRSSSSGGAVQPHSARSSAAQAPPRAVSSSGGGAGAAAVAGSRAEHARVQHAAPAAGAVAGGAAMPATSPHAMAEGHGPAGFKGPFNQAQRHAGAVAPPDKLQIQDHHQQHIQQQHHEVHTDLEGWGDSSTGQVYDAAQLTAVIPQGLASAGSVSSSSQAAPQQQQQQQAQQPAATRHGLGHATADMEAAVAAVGIAGGAADDFWACSSSTKGPRPQHHKPHLTGVQQQLQQHMHEPSEDWLLQQQQQQQQEPHAPLQVGGARPPHDSAAGDVSRAAGDLHAAFGSVDYVDTIAAAEQQQLPPLQDTASQQQQQQQQHMTVEQQQAPLQPLEAQQDLPTHASLLAQRHLHHSVSLDSWAATAQQQQQHNIMHHDSDAAAAAAAAYAAGAAPDAASGPSAAAAPPQQQWGGWPQEAAADVAVPQSAAEPGNLGTAQPQPAVLWQHEAPAAAAAAVHDRSSTTHAAPKGSAASAALRHGSSDGGGYPPAHAAAGAGAAAVGGDELSVSAEVARVGSSDGGAAAAGAGDADQLAAEAAPSQQLDTHGSSRPEELGQPQQLLPVGQQDQDLSEQQQQQLDQCIEQPPSRAAAATADPQGLSQLSGTGDGQSYRFASKPLFADDAADDSSAFFAGGSEPGAAPAAEPQPVQQPQPQAEQQQPQGGYTVASTPLFGAEPGTATASQAAVSAGAATAGAADAHAKNDSPSAWFDDHAGVQGAGHVEAAATAPAATGAADANGWGSQQPVAAAAGVPAVHQDPAAAAAAVQAAEQPAAAPIAAAEWPPGWFDDADGAEDEAAGWAAAHDHQIQAPSAAAAAAADDYTGMPTGAPGLEAAPPASAGGAAYTHAAFSGGADGAAAPVYGQAPLTHGTQHNDDGSAFFADGHEPAQQQQQWGEGQQQWGEQQQSYWHSLQPSQQQEHQQQQAGQCAQPNQQQWSVAAPQQQQQQGWSQAAAQQPSWDATMQQGGSSQQGEQQVAPLTGDFQQQQQQQGAAGLVGTQQPAAAMGASAAGAAAGAAAAADGLSIGPVTSHGHADDATDFFDNLTSPSPERSALLSAAAPEAAGGGAAAADDDDAQQEVAAAPAAADMTGPEQQQHLQAVPGTNADVTATEQQQQQHYQQPGSWDQQQQQHVDPNGWYQHQQQLQDGSVPAAQWGEQQQQQQPAGQQDWSQGASTAQAQADWGTQQYGQQQQQQPSGWGHQQDWSQQQQAWPQATDWTQQQQQQQSDWSSGQQYGGMYNNQYSQQYAGQQYGQQYGHQGTAWDPQQQQQQPYVPSAAGVSVQLTQEQQQHAFGGLGVPRPLMRRSSVASGGLIRKVSSPGLPSALIPSPAGVAPGAVGLVHSHSLGLQHQSSGGVGGIMAVGSAGMTSDGQGDSPAAAVTLGTQYQTLATYGGAGAKALLPAPPPISPPTVYQPGAPTGSATSAVSTYQQPYAGAAGAAQVFTPVAAGASAAAVSGGGDPAQQSYAGTYAWSQQQQQQQGGPSAAAPSFVMPDDRTLAVYAAAAPPLNFMEARKSPHGRPPCCFVVLGVGGRCVLQQPSLHSDMDLNFATMGAGCLHIQPLTQLVNTLKTVCPAAESYSAGPESYAPAGGISTGGTKGSSTTSSNSNNVLSLAAHSKFVESFPGPLSSSSSKDKVVKFLKDRLANFVQEEGLADAPSWQVDCRKALWELLLLMAQHQGQLKANYSASGSSKAAGLLRGAVTAAAGAAVSAATAAGAAAGTGASTGDAGSRGGSGAGTPKAGAAAAAAADGAVDSELLKILAPGLGSSPAAGGLRVLNQHVSDSELQSAATEMQRLLLMGRRHEALDVAVAGQLWGPALVLAYGYGEAKFHEVAASMAHRGLSRGTPLRTLALLLANRQDLIYEASLAASTAPGSIISPSATAGGGHPQGKSPSAPLNPSSAGQQPPGGGLMPSGGSTAAAAAAAAAGGLFLPSGGSGSYGFFSPSAGPRGDALLLHWRENLAVMAANRTAAGVEAMMRLGDLLLSQQGQLDAAHVCYLVAGVTPTPLDAGPAARMLLLGVNHTTTAGQRAMRQALPLMRSEVYEWARLLAGDSPQAWLSLLPYKLQLAATLADFGHVARALQYCNTIDAALRASTQASSSRDTPTGIPASLILTASQLEALRERLSVHAAAHNIKVVSNESTLGKLGRFLDKTINNLMWGGDVPAAAPQPAVAPTIPGAPAAGAGPAAGTTQAAGGVAGAVPGKGSWFGKPAPTPAAAPPPAAAAGAAGDGSSAAANLPAVGTWAQGAAGSAAGGAGTPQRQPPQQHATPTWGPGGLYPSPAPPGAQSHTSGLAGPGGAAGSSSPVGTGSSGSGMMAHHQRNMSQQSFTGGGWAGLQQLASFSDAGSTMHSRNPSHDSIAASLAAAGGLTPRPPPPPPSGSLGSTTAAVAAGGGAAAASAKQDPPPAGGAGGSAGPPAVGAAAKGGRDKDTGGGSTKGKKDAGPKEVPIGKEGGGWMRGIGSLLGAKQPKVAKLGLENDFYYCSERKKWVLRGQEDAADEDTTTSGPPPLSFSHPNLPAMQGGTGSGPPSSSGLSASGPPSPSKAAAAAAAAGPGGMLSTPPTSGPPSGGSATLTPGSSMLARPKTGGVASRYVQSGGINTSSSTTGAGSGTPGRLPGLPGALGPGGALPAAGTAPGSAPAAAESAAGAGESVGKGQGAAGPPSGSFFIPAAPASGGTEQSHAAAGTQDAAGRAGAGLSSGTDSQQPFEAAAAPHSTPQQQPLQQQQAGDVRCPPSPASVGASVHTAVSHGSAVGVTGLQQQTPGSSLHSTPVMVTPAGSIADLSPPVHQASTAQQQQQQPQQQRQQRSAVGVAAIVGPGGGPPAAFGAAGGQQGGGGAAAAAAAAGAPPAADASMGSAAAAAAAAAASAAPQMGPGSSAGSGAAAGSSGGGSTGTGQLPAGYSPGSALAQGSAAAGGAVGTAMGGGTAGAQGQQQQQQVLAGSQGAAVGPGQDSGQQSGAPGAAAAAAAGGLTSVAAPSSSWAQQQQASAQHGASAASSWQPQQQQQGTVYAQDVGYDAYFGGQQAGGQQQYHQQQDSYSYASVQGQPGQHSQHAVAGSAQPQHAQGYSQYGQQQQQQQQYGYTYGQQQAYGQQSGYTQQQHAGQQQQQQQQGYGQGYAAQQYYGQQSAGGYMQPQSSMGQMQDIQL